MMIEHNKKSGEANTSRRRFLKAGTLTGVTLAAGATFGKVTCEADDSVAPKSDKFKITITGYPYDRVAGLADGGVKVDGCDTKFEPGRIGEMNTHVFSGLKTREVTEIGLLPFILAMTNADFRDYGLIPVFPLRTFRHKSIFIRTDRGISKPEDLRGRKIATPGYSSTSLTWIRGILQHEYGVKPDQVKWIVSSKESSSAASGGASKWENVMPKGITIDTGPKGKDESQLLVDGDVDAVFHAAEPEAYQKGHPKITRLFPDSRKTERAYYAKTGIFPIMHAVAIRRDLFDSHPWLPKAAFTAYSQAKQLAYDDINQNAWFMASLPWISQEAEATRKLMGENYYSYGVTPNRKALEALLQYAHEQGLAKRKLTIEELFHPSTLKLKEVIG
jgi:4,5-dihydroxyphthalate decarboxylase